MKHHPHHSFAHLRDAIFCSNPRSSAKARCSQRETPAMCVQDAHAAPHRRRVITVRRQPRGRDEISYEEWEELGRELGSNCPRVKAFLRQRDPLHQGETSSPAPASKDRVPAETAQYCRPNCTMGDAQEIQRPNNG
jgi:hypothetical protein